jgi:hypothetical protein
MSVDGSTIFREFAVSSGGGGSILFRDDGIWQSLFASDVIRHYTRDGVFIEDIAVGSSFPGFPGPDGLASSFINGFLITDSLGRLVETDKAGNEVAAVSTKSLNLPGFVGVASDVDHFRIFLQDNQQIVIASSEFIGFTPVPELSTLPLVALGTLGVLGYGRRQRPKGPAACR